MESDCSKTNNSTQFSGQALRHVLFACPGRSCDEYFVIFYIYNGFIPIYDLNFVGTKEFPETIVGGLAGAAGGGDQPGQVLPDKGNRVEHDAVETVMAEEMAGQSSIYST